MVSFYNCLEKFKRIWPNKVKAAAAALQMMFGMAIASLGAWNYIYYQ